jgi:hypothetical protein
MKLLAVIIATLLIASTAWAEPACKYDSEAEPADERGPNTCSEVQPDEVERAAWNCSGTIIKLTRWRPDPALKGESEGSTDYIFHFEPAPPKRFRIRMHDDGPQLSEKEVWANGKPCQLVRKRP